MSELGDLLAEARKALGLTLRQVEDQTGIPNAHTSQIESGTIEKPAPHILWDYARIYGLDYGKLMRLAGHWEPGRGPAKRKNVVAALRALDELDTDEQNRALNYMAEIARTRQSRGRGRK
ncbi:MAG: helix-turn-helix transcriptional regulator [Actinomycetota bacterium]